MFTEEEREQLRDRVLEMARTDKRVIAGAEVGSMSLGEGDRWSDIDLTFGLAEGVAPLELLEDWQRSLGAEYDVVHLFDLSAGATVYRVFLLGGGLQLDVSATPGDVVATSPRFRLLFGNSRAESIQPRSVADIAGWAVLWARDTRVRIARGQHWMAEHSLASLRQHCLALACVRFDLPPSYGRGFDRLPPELLDGYRDTFPASVDPEELKRALELLVIALERELGEHEELDPKLAVRLRELESIH